MSNFKKAIPGEATCPTFAGARNHTVLRRFHLGEEPQTIYEGKQAGPVDQNYLRTYMFSGDGERLAIANPKEIRFIDLATGKSWTWTPTKHYRFTDVHMGDRGELAVGQMIGGRSLKQNIWVYPNFGSRRDGFHFWSNPGKYDDEYAWFCGNHLLAYQIYKNEISQYTMRGKFVRTLVRDRTGDQLSNQVCSSSRLLLIDDDRAAFSTNAYFLRLKQ